MIVEPHYSLAQAVQRFFPDGPITVSTLRNAIRDGHLQATKPQGKLLVTESWLWEWLQKCRVAKNLRACGSSPPNPSETPAQHELPSGASLTERNELALAAANAILCKLSKSSPTT
jgi:hypothetical protein